MQAAHWAISETCCSLGRCLAPTSPSRVSRPSLIRGCSKRLTQAASAVRRNLLIPLADAKTQREHSLPSRDELLDLWLASMFPDASAADLQTKRAELAQAMEWIEVWILYRVRPPSRPLSACSLASAD